MKRKSAVIDAQCGDRLIFGLVNPDEDALYQLQSVLCRQMVKW